LWSKIPSARNHYSNSSKKHVKPVSQPTNTENTNNNEKKHSLALFKPKSMDNMVKLKDLKSGTQKSNLKNTITPSTEEMKWDIEQKNVQVAPEPLKQKNDKVTKKHSEEDDLRPIRKPRVSISEGCHKSHFVDTENINPRLSASGPDNSASKCIESGSRSPKQKTRTFRKKIPSDSGKSKKSHPSVKRTVSHRSHDAKELSLRPTRII